MELIGTCKRIGGGWRRKREGMDSVSELAQIQSAKSPLQS